MTLDKTPRKWPELRDNECTLKEALAVMVIMGTVLGGLALASQSLHVHEYKYSTMDTYKMRSVGFNGNH
jgi:hypothetical protein